MPAKVNCGAGGRAVPDTVAFHRTELSIILGLYGRAVAAGIWRDYGISMLRATLTA